MKKRILASLMALCLAVGLLPMPAAADGGEGGSASGGTTQTLTQIAE